MSYKIVVDSCCELPEELKGDSRFERIPLGLEVGDYQIQDDENFNQAEFLQKVAECSKCPKSACPSPERYMQAYHTEAEHIYVVTLSAKLSGSHNSAVLGKSLYEEQYGPKQIAIIDSWSASGGECQIALKIAEMEEDGLPFEEIVQQAETYKEHMNTYFVLDNLETLRKNGRLTGVKALVASTLNIKPVMGAEKGVIVQRGQCVGMKKALSKMVEMIAAEAVEATEKRVIITHCNCLSRAELVKEMLTARQAFKEILIMDTAGVSSLYANDGGIIVTV